MANPTTKRIKDFKARMDAIEALSSDKKRKLLQRIGVIGPEGGLTTRFGGHAPLDVLAIKAREKELAALRSSRGTSGNIP